MNKDKKKKLKKRGWVTTTVQELLDLTDEQMDEVKRLTSAVTFAILNK